MFDGLDDINWRDLQHGYGSAKDTPRHIRRLLSSSASVRMAAIGELESSINHQGNVYNATVPAIRFLVEASQHLQGEERIEILFLLADIAKGRGWFTNHGSFAFVQRAFHVNRIERERKREALVDADLREELSHVAPAVIPLLDFEPAAVRLAASHLLTQLPDSADVVTKALASRFSVETDDSVRANVLRCLVTVNRDVANELSETVNCHVPASMTVALACAIIIAEKQDLNCDRASILRRQVLNDSTEMIDLYCSLPSVDDYFIDLATSITMSDRGFAEQVSDRIVEIQRQLPHPKFMGNPRAFALLLLALHPGGVRTPVADLEAWQKVAVWFVACLAWPKAKDIRYDIVDVLEEFDLPTRPELLANAIGYSIEQFDWYRPKRWWRFWQ